LVGKDTLYVSRMTLVIALLVSVLAVVKGRSIQENVFEDSAGGAFEKFLIGQTLGGKEKVNSSGEDRQDFTGENGLYFLPVDDADSLQDVYNRERLPRISQVLTSGHADDINEVLKEAQEDPFTITPYDLKFEQIILYDLYIGFQIQSVLFFIFLALLLPAMIPFLEIGIILVEEAIVWAIASTT
jgi:hypothetical protein